MSIQKPKEDIKQHCDKSIETLRLFLEETIDTQDPMLADKLAYWIEDYTKFMRKEREIEYFATFKRGAVIKAHLGFRIGSEQGGLHYCVILSDSGKRQRVVQVIPLTSQKPKHDVNNLPKGSIYIGNDLQQKLYLKTKSIQDENEHIINICSEQLQQLQEDKKNDPTDSDVLQCFRKVSKQIEVARTE